MESIPNEFEVMMQQYQEAVDYAYNSQGPEAAAILEMELSIKKAGAYMEMGMRDCAREELEAVIDATAFGGIFAGTNIYDDACALMKHIEV